MAAEPHRIYLAEKPMRDCPCLFLDRDGTIIEDPGYIADPNDVRLIPGVSDSLRQFQAAGYALVIVTNQSGIGRGLYGWRDYNAVAERLDRLLGEEGIVFDAVLACSHAPDGGAPCDWRKPAPGMIDEAAAMLALDKSRSLLVGDKLSDILAAEAAGLPRAIHVASGQGARAEIATRQFSIAVDYLDDLSELTL